MFDKPVIALLCVILAGLQQAKASTPCNSIDTVVRSLSALRHIQADGHPNLAARKVAALDKSLAAVSLSAIHQRIGQQVVRTQYTVVAGFIHETRLAVSAYNGGAIAQASAILHSAIPASIGASVAELQRAFRCAANRAASPRPIYTSKQANPKRAAYDTAIIANTGKHVSRLEPGSPASMHRMGIPAAWQFLLMLVGVSAVAAVMATWQSNQTHQQREERHICHQPILVWIRRRSAQLIIVDFTRFGMKLDHRGLIKDQRTLHFQLNKKWSKGKIVWHNSIFAGVKFSQPLTDEQYLALKRVSHASGMSSSIDEKPEAA